MVQVDGRFPPRTAISRPPAGKLPEAMHQQMLKDGSVLIAAGHQIEKLPLCQLSRSMTGHLRIAAVARPDRQRLLRPKTRPTVNKAERPIPDPLTAISSLFPLGTTTVSSRRRPT
jgi:hypothetical protein